MLSESLRCSFGTITYLGERAGHHWPAAAVPVAGQTTERQCSVRQQPVDDLSGQAPTSSPARSTPNPSSTEVSYTFGLMTDEAAGHGVMHIALRASVYSVSASFRQAPRIRVQARNLDLPGRKPAFHPAASASLAPAGRPTNPTFASVSSQDAWGVAAERLGLRVEAGARCSSSWGRCQPRGTLSRHEQRKPRCRPG